MKFLYSAIVVAAIFIVTIIKIGNEGKNINTRKITSQIFRAQQLAAFEFSTWDEIPDLNKNSEIHIAEIEN